MLSKASTIFNGLTMDSFSRLLVDSEGDAPRLFGIRPSGEQVDVTGMSEGSRDQLYLALRLDKENNPIDALIDQVEKIKASIRAKVEHPFRVLKQQFGYVKVRYRGLKKNTAQIVTLFALSNLWMARHTLLQCMGQVRVQGA